MRRAWMGAFRKEDKPAAEVLGIHRREDDHKFGEIIIPACVQLQSGKYVYFSPCMFDTAEDLLERFNMSEEELKKFPKPVNPKWLLLYLHSPDDLPSNFVFGGKTEYFIPGHPVSYVEVSGYPVNDGRNDVEESLARVEDFYQDILRQRGKDKKERVAGQLVPSV